MKGIARICFPDGGLFLSVKTAYERELFFEHVHMYTKRHGQVRFELNRKECSVTLSNTQPGSCARCERVLDNFTYALDGRSLCGGCARRDLW